MVRTEIHNFMWCGFKGKLRRPGRVGRLKSKVFSLERSRVIRSQNRMLFGKQSEQPN